MILVVTGVSLLAQPRISKEIKEFYDNKRIEYNNENTAIGEEILKVSKMPAGTEKDQKENEIKEREIRYKNESSKTMDKMKQDGYVNDEEILDSNSKLIKKLEGLRKITEWDIRGYQDKDLIDFETKQLNKIITLLEKVKKSDDSKFTELLGEYNEMINSFKKERPLFQEQYKKQHNQ